jgi:hypothetical protein
LCCRLCNRAGDQIWQHFARHHGKDDLWQQAWAHNVAGGNE